MKATLLLTLSALVAGAVHAHLWPIPQTVSLGEGTAFVARSLVIQSNCRHDALQDTIRRYTRLLALGLFQPPTKYNDTSDPTPATTLRRVTVTVSTCTNVTHPALGDDESYTLRVGEPAANTSANIEAASVWGALRAIETLSQLTYNNLNGDLVVGQLPVTISDRPAYPHRGLLLDTARNFFPVEDIRRTLDAMAYNKFNVFHWHIVDAQSWPVESRFLPALAIRGAYSAAMTYSHEDVAGIIEYARLRGIRVIPEFDMPGHTSVVSNVLPEIMTCVNSQPRWDLDAAEPPSGQLNPLLPRTYQFVEAVVNEYAPLFPDQFFHTGSDEVNTHCWETTPSIRQYLNSTGLTSSDLLATFVNTTQGYLAANRKTGMIWEEAILDFNLTLPQDSVVQVWRSAENVQKVVAKGHRVLANSYEYWYLDCGHGGWLGNNPTGNSWCDPFKHWQRVYSYDPVANITSSAARDLVIGGDVCLWTEQVDTTNLDRTLWPRAAAAAEVLWSGKDANGQLRSAKEALVRIQEQRFRLVSRGIMAEPLQPLWCARNPGMCDLPPPS
ncbi:Glucosamine-6-phosphate isomerase (Glucosamine-6-phosphate deaminase) (GNPDA) (GlcN6P deaminase) [Tieghemiomyces parasiticus]|uniref:Beta-hexosaminidase n=1 Tax=Tieghemiomyces parasiticus TaxID=78921 RepID=A0A9W7ZWI1_9FUNG|nr:Glucosamine-6-phosphate isomerase (Glucosamine-6-phosphate deaminase) (GNPDA) (GlcN6P deaminase) [Tieghemiomyces parasiticus]